MTIHLRTALLLIFFPGVFEKAFSQTISELSFIAPLISTFDMDYQNDHLYITQQYLKIFDVSDPENPQLEGSVLYPGSYAYHIAVEDKHAYMAMGGTGIFAMYNVTDPAMPYLTGSLSIPSTTSLLAGDIAPFGNYVFMSGFDSLYVIDVSDSSAPAVINTQEIAGISFSGAGDMGIVDAALFITTPTALQIFDISDPANPSLLTSYVNSHSGQKGIAIDPVGRRLFLPWVNSAGTHTGYDAVDVSNPSFPFFLFSDSIPFSGGEYGEVTYYVNMLFISQGGGVNAFDVSPFNHHYVTSYTGPNVPNASVALDIRDSVFYNVRGGGFEVLLYSGGFPTAVTELNEPFSLQLFPNPMTAATQELSFFVSKPISNASVVIYNAMGAVVSRDLNKSFATGENRITLPPNLSSGFYFISMIINNQSFTEKVMVD